MDIVHNIQFDTSGQYRRQFHQQALNEVVGLIPYADTCESADKFVKTVSKITYNHPNQKDIMWTLFDYFRDKTVKASNSLEKNGFMNLSNLLFERTFWKDNKIIPLNILKEIPISPPKKRAILTETLHRIVQSKDANAIAELPEHWKNIATSKICLDFEVVEKTGINIAGKSLEKNMVLNLINDDTTHFPTELIFNTWLRNEGREDQKIYSKILDNLLYIEFRHTDDCPNKIKILSEYNTPELLEKAKIIHLKKSIQLIEKHFGQYTLEKFAKGLKSFKP